MRTIIICLYLGLLNSVALGWKDVHLPMEKDKKTTSEVPKPWIRTIYSSKKEIVTPTVIGGVTFSKKPLPTPDPLEPWVSLEKDGSPKTIKPEIKNGRTNRASPTYNTYFQTLTTKTYSYEELKAHNMDPNDVYEEEVFIDEDDTYTSLNPIIRCTPDRYFKKGLAKDISSEPFCTPRENSVWKVGKTYFITWYTHFLTDENSDKVSEEVRIHLSYVKEKLTDKGYNKRDLSATFFSSEWVKNVDGVFPITIEQDWLQGYFDRKIVVSVQPSHISDDDFDPLENGVMIHIMLGSKVAKQTEEDRVRIDAVIYDQEWYYVALTIPTVVIVAFVAMYFFLQLTRGDRDISDVTRDVLSKQHRVLGTFAKMKKYKNIKNHKYSELPKYNKKSTKQT